ASLDPAPAAIAPLAPAPAPMASQMPVTSQTTDATPSERVEVPLPPRRPSAVLLASAGRPIVAKKAVAAPVLEASALPADQ
ncbi:MAG: lytic transglycosylase domain-containing protein, partial [Methylobacterium sp.]|nr:lytic transglycosylase domain-containing protein [Methylobacterium sp.]